MDINFNNNLCGCNPIQIINFEYAFNTVDNIKIYDKCNNEYTNLEYAYSLDNVCWSCYMNYNELLVNTIELHTDFYIRIKVSGNIGNITIDDKDFYDYKTCLWSGFNFTYCTTSSNNWNPYSNVECAIALQQALTETAACLVGVPIYYFKLSPNVGSKDITFKEYALMDVETVKQIKLVVTDGTMPSSKPEFNDWGLDWQTDWECEIAKGMFATAFGPTAQPIEGDLIWIPMMKRMWMINGAYEEKKDAFMWNATTFKVTLVKYQEKASVDLGETEQLVNTFVKNKYEDLFGEDENIQSNQETTDSPLYAANRLYPVFESDATRKYVSCDDIEFKEEMTYYKGTLISDRFYKFNNVNASIVYQHHYCGDSGVISFIIRPTSNNVENSIICVGNIKVKIKQNVLFNEIYLSNNPDKPLVLHNDNTYFIVIRWSKKMNLVELLSAKYVYNDKIPVYKLQPHHYYYDMDNMEKQVYKWDIEMTVDNKSEVYINGFAGCITNFKLFGDYNDNISEILQTYPTHQQLIINDPCRKILDLPGVKI